MSNRHKKPAGKAVEWYSLHAAEDEAELFIYDEIAWYGVDAQKLVKDLSALKTDKITVRLNTPGGNVFDGLAIYHALKSHKATIETHIDGLAASIGSVIALAGDTVHMAESAFFMIHNPWVLATGTAEDMRKVADVLDKIGGSIEQVYVDSSGMRLQDVKAAMDAETWYTADEAIEAGFADQISETNEVAAMAQAKFDLSAFKHVPSTVKAATAPGTHKAFERLLRDAGFSRKQATAIAAEGFGVVGAPCISINDVAAKAVNDFLDMTKRNMTNEY